MKVCAIFSYEIVVKNSDFNYMICAPLSLAKWKENTEMNGEETRKSYTNSNCFLCDFRGSVCYCSLLHITKNATEA